MTKFVIRLAYIIAMHSGNSLACRNLQWVIVQTACE
jgi:hypothetical protein